jgi:hypothetical protein
MDDLSRIRIRAVKSSDFAKADASAAGRIPVIVWAHPLPSLLTHLEHGDKFD